MMTKDEALKMAIEALDTLMMEKGSIYYQAINACKEALEQPTEPRLVSYAPDGSTCTLNIDGEEVYFNREQPTVAELNGEYLRDTNVMGLEQPAQRNFCERCGKRASKDLNYIHTCTPPQALKEKNT
jgi:hypothetical protein